MGRFNVTSHSFMPAVRISLPLALALSLGVHAGLLALWTPPHPPSTVPQLLQVSLMGAPIQEIKPARPAIRTPQRAEKRKHVRVVASPSLPPAPEKTLASMAAPPAPTAEEWRLASTYTLKNSKRYRYNWGQLVRSMMGTAVEGVQQGLVRFHIEIAPDGKLARVAVLWSTSEIAEKLALQAIQSLPPLPPTPTGKPLVFEKTIAFMPFETGWPPIYKYDCLPDPPSFHNAFAWDGSSPQRTSQAHPENALPSTSAAPQSECPPDSVPDSIEAEARDMERQFKEWGAGRLNGAD
jgi:hypothetical protein